MFAIGLPIGTLRRLGSRSHCHQVTSIDASVGPYRLCNSPLSTARQRCSASHASASPLQITRRTLPHRSTPRSPRNCCNIEGTKCSVVTPCASITSTRYALSRCPSGRAITNRAPASSGQKNSQTETSKLNGVFWRTWSVAVRPYACCIQRRRLVTALRVFMAPLGRPVEPDVKIT